MIARLKIGYYYNLELIALKMFKINSLKFA